MGHISNIANIMRTRADPEDRAFDSQGISDCAAEDVLLRALIGNTSVVRSTALNIPSLSGCINYIANSVSMLPIKLYKETNNKVEEVKNDPRVRILNDDTGDTLDTVQFWRAMIFDYFLSKGAYAYINKMRNDFKSINYVESEYVAIQKNSDPIFKDYDIMVNGNPYKPYEFFKLLRNTKDGCLGVSLLEESPKLLSIIYNTLIFEDNLVSKGGNKKGFVKAPRQLTTEAMDELKAAWRKLYGNGEENVVVLNNGLEFQEASSTSVELQLNENKETNSSEICKLLNVPEAIINGSADEKTYVVGFKLAVSPMLRVIECALNRDYLLEREKHGETIYYWAFDTKELTKGDIKSRYDAYKVGIDSNFLQPDEVRYMEDLEPLGLEFIKLGLDTVLYDPKTKTIYTPNTGQYQDLTKNTLEGGDKTNENRNSE